jgi:hypothetical protein
MDAYLSWQDLASEDESGPAGPSPNLSIEPPPQAPGVPLPPEISALIEERQRLEQQMAALTGQAAPDPEDERRQRAFPVRVHTKESRIEERRLRLHDEKLRMLANRQLAAARLCRRREAERIAREEDERQRRAQEMRVKEEMLRRQDALRAERREEIALEERDAERQDAAARGRALEAAERKAEEERWQAHLGQRRDRAEALRARRRREEEAEEERAAERNRKAAAKLAAARAEAREPVREPDRTREAQQPEPRADRHKREAVLWEARQEALRKKALERRAEAKADERRRERARVKARSRE